MASFLDIVLFFFYLNCIVLLRSLLFLFCTSTTSESRVKILPFNVFKPPQVPSKAVALFMLIHCLFFIILITLFNGDLCQK